CVFIAVSRADRERWDRKYANRNPNAAFAPEPLLVEYQRLLDGRGMALDVACGVGHNAMFLARHGYEVMAVDASLAGLRYARAELAATGLTVHLVAADLDDFVFPRDRFALAVVFRFLDRALVPRIKQTVLPGGLVFYQTFNVNQLRFAPQMHRDYLLEPGELTRLFADFETLATNDAPDNSAPLSYWIGQRRR
ncbi:MAG TPA: class I SAM-dependent methyltransferase, partial [Candidatus Elarobacter sp.]